MHSVVLSRLPRCVWMQTVRRRQTGEDRRPERMWEKRFGDEARDRAIARWGHSESWGVAQRSEHPEEL
jgi:hypothetical protein